VLQTVPLANGAPKKLISQQSTDRTATEKIDVAINKRENETHIGVLSVHASDEIGEAILLLIFVWDENGISVQRALVYLEPCLVCNPVTVSEGRSGRMMISGHIMDGSTRIKDEVDRNNLAR
jgi:hypothetical protein